MSAHTPGERNESQRKSDGNLVFPGGPVEIKPNVLAVRHETPAGTFYTFFCKNGHQHQARHETANCSATKEDK